MNITNTSATLDSLIFDNDNVVKALPNYGSVSSDSGTNLYRFTLPVEFDNKSSETFGKISDGLGTLVVSGQTSLNGMLEVYVDNKSVSELRIPVELAGKNISTLSIIGSGKSVNDVLVKETSLELAAAGEMPAGIKLESTAAIAAQNGWLIFLVPAFAAVLSIIGVIACKAIKKLNAVKTLVATIFLESIYIFGMFAIVQTFTSWVIDTYALIGVCMSITISFIDIAILAKVGREKTNRLTIFAFVASFIALFTPLSGLGISLILGLLLHALVTKPFLKRLI